MNIYLKREKQNGVKVCKKYESFWKGGRGVGASTQ